MYKILLLGAGSVGLYLGTQLYAAGHEVQLYGRRKLAAIVNQSETLEINGIPYRRPPAITQLQPVLYNLVLVTTKLQAIPGAVSEIEQAQLNPQIIGFVQNGLVEASLYGPFAHHPGFVTLSLFNGYHLTDSRLTVAESHLGIQVPDSSAGHKLCELFSTAGIACHPCADIENMRAQKLILNCALNALSALEQKPMAALVTDRSLQPLIANIISEGWAVLHSDYALPSPAELLEHVYQIAQQVPLHYSSTYQDLVTGRSSEIDFLNGTLVERGNQKGIPTPYNQQICQRVKAIENAQKANAMLLLT